MPRQAEAGRAEVVELLERIPGVLWHWCRDGRQCDGTPGLPDLLITGPRGVLFREVKPDHYSLRPLQVAWKWQLLSAGADWDVWTPADFRSGRAEAEIRALLG